MNCRALSAAGAGNVLVLGVHVDLNRAVVELNVHVDRAEVLGAQPNGEAVLTVGAAPQRGDHGRQLLMRHGGGNRSGVGMGILDRVDDGLMGRLADRVDRRRLDGVFQRRGHGHEGIAA